MAQAGFQIELLFLVGKWNEGIISRYSLQVGHQNGRKVSEKFLFTFTFLKKVDSLMSHTSPYSK